MNFEQLPEHIQAQAEAAGKKGVTIVYVDHIRLDIGQLFKKDRVAKTLAVVAASTTVVWLVNRLLDWIGPAVLAYVRVGF